MMDFLSTRINTDSESARCARLLAAVIAAAIEDAGNAPTNEELKNQRNICKKACAAIHWLFDEQSVFPLYASLIGVDAESIRRALLEVNVAPDSVSGKLFKPTQRRALRLRYRWLANDKDVNFKPEDYDE